MNILIAGDFCPFYRVASLIKERKGMSVFPHSLMQEIQDADYSIVNFECTVAESTDRPIIKSGPNLHCTSDAVNLVKEVGFNCVTLANNHFRDYGNVGVDNTLTAIKENGLDYVGGGKDIIEATRILYKEIKGDKLAIINVCENEFSIANDKRGGAAPLDTIDVFHRIKEAREKADYIIVIVHGGHEHFQYPSPRMKKLYRFFVEAGADAVVNHHQHCFSGYEEYMGKSIFYGLGNFCFDWKGKRDGIWNEGYMVKLDFNRKSKCFTVLPYIQCDKEPVIEMLEASRSSSFWKKLNSINETINDESLFEKEYEKYVDEKVKTALTSFTPYTNEYLRVAAGRGYLPSFIPKKKVAQMLNFIICESHRDILLESMQRKIE